MKKLISSLLIFSMTFASISKGDSPKNIATSSSSNDIKLSTDGPAIISPIQKGQTSPFSGILFSPRAAASIASDISSFPLKLKIEVDAAVKKSEAQKDFEILQQKTSFNADKLILESDINAKQKRINQLENDLKISLDSSPSRSTWFGLGFAGGVVVTLLTVFVIVKSTK